MNGTGMIARAHAWRKGFVNGCMVLLVVVSAIVNFYKTVFKIAFEFESVCNLSGSFKIIIFKIINGKRVMHPIKYRRFTLRWTMRRFSTQNERMCFFFVYFHFIYY